ncbi:PREDICTED: WD repeat-containing protein VIP3-like [Nelumbo nucifera]|uniref:WD repeat-containing protein VIP3-like n=1 Tax=Nelumbo nucifera TaxID=4432 RepID=A0A1U7Z4H2_NELNU|nr:PREDICTED: WD repeat-containing protein VIP3-like [Nelumbo nucifera]
MKLAGLKSIENAHEESVWAVTWVPATDARPALLLTGSLDETVKLWRPDELVLEGTNTGHCLGVVSVAAHPSGVIAASASLDSFVRVFDVDTNATIATLEAPPSEVWQMKFDPKVNNLHLSYAYFVIPASHGYCNSGFHLSALIKSLAQTRLFIIVVGALEDNSKVMIKWMKEGGEGFLPQERIWKDFMGTVTVG